MNPQKKYTHAVFVLKSIRDNPESHDVVIRCCDGDVPCNSLFLAASSQMLQNYLHELENAPNQEPLVIVPSLSVQDAGTFLRYVI